MGTPTIRAGTVPPRRGWPGQLRVHTLTLETPLSRTTIFFAASFSVVARAQSKRWIWAAVAFLGTWPGIAFADSATVAVSSNFAATARGLVEVFEAQNIHEIRVATGSSGKLYAQIQNGAPFDVFLSADMARPEQLVAESIALGETLRVYALGRLLLWRPKVRAAGGRSELGSSPGPGWLSKNRSRHVALANPELAPYGQASREVLEGLNLMDEVRPRMVFGENIGQTYAMVATGNATVGFIARAQLPTSDQLDGTVWEIPLDLHLPIEQGVVQLSRAKENAAAKAFVAYLASDVAKEFIRNAGYEVE